MEKRKLKNMLMPQVTLRVSSRLCMKRVICPVSSMPRVCEVSATSLPMQYMITEGWL